jgi:glycine hydroxymethyltransferase
MGATEMKTIGALIARILRDPENEAEQTAVAAEVMALCRRFPIYPDREYATA